MTPPTRRNELCPCGSGERFKHCCGDFTAAPPTSDRTSVEPFLGLRDRIFVEPGFLSEQECSSLVEVAGRLHREEAAVTRENPQGLVTEHSTYRQTTLIKSFDEPSAFLPTVARAFREHVEPAFAVQVEWFEWPDVLLYGAGGRYDVHTDADLPDRESSGWRRVMDRDISLLLYLNDTYTGGELVFPARETTIRPQTGMLVAFPSDHRFAHAAMPVTSGTRYVIVSWAAVTGSPRIHRRRRLNVIYPHRTMLPDHLPLQHVAGAGYLIEPRNPEQK
jgi:predicted 2-oxoglutarate/Fe(II)-dependent dioxygenase YbiX